MSGGAPGTRAAVHHSRQGAAARRPKGDTRPRSETAPTPQTKQRIDLGRYKTYEDAAVSVIDEELKGSQQSFQIRKRADGYHVYRREVIARQKGILP